MLEKAIKLYRNPKKEIKKFFCTNFGTYESGKTTVNNITLILFSLFYLIMFFAVIILPFYVLYIIVINIDKIIDFIMNPIIPPELITIFIKLFSIAIALCLTFYILKITGTLCEITELLLKKGLTCDGLIISPEVKNVFDTVSNFDYEHKKEFLRGLHALESKLISDVHNKKEKNT